MAVAKIDYRARLDRAAAELGGGALLAMSQPFVYRNANVEHVYRQESSLYYLTGFAEPDCALLVLPFRPVGQRYVLFLREKDPERELWDGRRLGTAAATKHLAVDQAYPIGALWDMLPDLLGEADKLYYLLGLSEENDRHLIRALATHKARFAKLRTAAKVPLHDQLELMGRLRRRKEPTEVERMRQAAAITRQGFDKVYKNVRPGMTERQVHAMLVGTYLESGSEMEAYGAIVAGGANACILHYRENHAELKDGDLLLIDSGSQFDYYASDVTRTFPIGKRFTGEQRAAYDIVLAAQKSAIAKAVVGSSLPAIHDEATNVLVDGLLHLKILKGSRQEIIERGLHKRYYPHGTSHWIGMDVHDLGVYAQGGKPVALEAGMYFSVEPGLYFDPSEDGLPAGFKGVGIRVEDDVLVTASGPEVLTAGIAKEVSQLENRY